VDLPRRVVEVVVARISPAAGNAVLTMTTIEFVAIIRKMVSLCPVLGLRKLLTLPHYLNCIVSPK
jgi:hypothetical protein